MPPQPPQLPICFNATAESILRETEELLTECRVLQDAIITGNTPETADFVNALKPWLQIDNQIIAKQQLIEFYADVSPNEKVRDAAEIAKGHFQDFATRTALRGDLYSLFNALRTQDLGLDNAEAAYLLRKLLLDLEHKGLGLPQKKQDRLAEVSERLRLAQREHLKTFGVPSEGRTWFSRDELEGVSDSVLHEAEQGNGQNEGKIRLRIHGKMSFMRIMAQARHLDTRRQVYQDFVNSYRGNTSLLQEIMLLRAEKAHILGYATHAELMMSTRMEKSPQTISDFLAQLLQQISSSRSQMVAAWKHSKSEDLKRLGAIDDGKFRVWDRYYYADRSLQRGLSQESNTLNDFFPFTPTLQGILRIFEDVFSLCFVSSTAGVGRHNEHTRCDEGTVWHEDVEMYTVWENTDGARACTEFVGYLYLDLFQRAGKRPGFADLPVQPAFTDTDASRRYPSTCLAFNFTKAQPGQSHLMSHSEVVLIVHELGHGIHDLVAKTQFAQCHGASTAGDFNEAPSQMLENWCWQPSILQRLSRHPSSISSSDAASTRSTGNSPSLDVAASIPSEMIAALIRSKREKDLIKCLSLLEMSLFDMALNTWTHNQDITTWDPATTHETILQQVWGVDLPAEPLSAYNAEPGYTAVSGMYIYLTSLLYAQDMFHSAFATDPMDSASGLRYREAILQKGSSEDEMTLLAAFLGRPPQPNAYFGDLGLTA